jgi:YbbR domain-containing protein
VLQRVIGFFTDNWALKLAALGMAILLWMGVRASEPERATFPGIPVEVDLRDPDWQLERLDPPTVRVTVQGPTGELLTLANDPPQIIFPVERVNDTLESQVVPLQWVRLPGEIRDARVLMLRPDTIRMHFQRLASTTLPVKVTTRGELPDGFSLVTPVSTNPGVLVVRGTERQLRALDSIPLLPVDVSGVRSTTNVPTRVDTAAISGVSVAPEEVNVILRVAADSVVEPADSNRQRPPF